MLVHIVNALSTKAIFVPARISFVGDYNSTQEGVVYASCVGPHFFLRFTIGYFFHISPLSQSLGGVDFTSGVRKSFF